MTTAACCPRRAFTRGALARLHPTTKIFSSTDPLVKSTGIISAVSAVTKCERRDRRGGICSSAPCRAGGSFAVSVHGTCASSVVSYDRILDIQLVQHLWFRFSVISYRLAPIAAGSPMTTILEEHKIDHYRGLASELIRLDERPEHPRTEVKEVAGASTRCRVGSDPQLFYP